MLLPYLVVTPITYSLFVQKKERLFLCAATKTFFFLLFWQVEEYISIEIERAQQSENRIFLASNIFFIWMKFVWASKAMLNHIRESWTLEWIKMKKNFICCCIRNDDVLLTFGSTFLLSRYHNRNDWHEKFLLHFSISTRKNCA